MKNDHEVIQAVLKKNPFTLQFYSDIMKNNKDEEDEPKNND